MLSLALLFFFQAEDGIRDLVRSRGLGDVYKRQITSGGLGPTADDLTVDTVAGFCGRKMVLDTALEAVSYTHLTLPTSDLV